MTVVINGTSGITDVNGSAAAPAITGTDTDTGVFFGTNTVSLSTGGTERVTLDASGNLGIGLTSPSTYGQLAVGTVASNGWNTTGFVGNRSSAAQTIHAMGFWNNTTKIAEINMQTDGSSTGGAFVFATASGGTLSNRIKFDYDGGLYVLNGTSDFQRTTGTPAPFRVMNAGQSGNNRNMVIFDANYASGNSSDLWFTKNSSSSYIWRLIVDTAANGGSNFSFASGAGGAYGVQLSSTSATSWSSNSDIRLKDVTGVYENALAGISQLQAIKFTWKDDESKKPCVGVSAQSVLPIVPEAVECIKHVGDESETEYLSVRYTELIPILIAGIQEQQAIITQLQADVQALKGNV